MKKIILIFIILLVITAGFGTGKAAAFEIVGYSYSTPSSAQFSQLTEIIWGFVEPNPPAMNFSVNGDTSLISSMCSHGIPCSFQIYAPYGSSASSYNAIFTNATARQNLINS